MAALGADVAIFVGLALALGAGTWLRLRHPENAVAASASRAGLWLLAVAGTSMVLRLGGVA